MKVVIFLNTNEKSRTTIIKYPMTTKKNVETTNDNFTDTSIALLNVTYLRFLAIGDIKFRFDKKTMSAENLLK